MIYIKLRRENKYYMVGDHLRLSFNNLNDNNFILLFNIIIDRIIYFFEEYKQLEYKFDSLK